MGPSLHYSLSKQYEVMLSDPFFRTILSEKGYLKKAVCNGFPLLTIQQLSMVLDSFSDQEIRTRVLIDAMSPDQIRYVLIPRFTKVVDKTDLESIHKRVLKLSKIILHLDTLVKTNSTQNLSYRVQQALDELNSLTQAITPVKGQLRNLFDLKDDQIELILNEEKYQLINPIYLRIKSVKKQLDEDFSILFSMSKDSIRQKLASLVTRYESKDSDNGDIPAYEALSEWGMFTQLDCDLYAEILGHSDSDNSMQFVINFLEKNKIETKEDLQERLAFPVTKIKFIELLKQLKSA